MHIEINKRHAPRRLRLNSYTGKWELRIDNQDEGPGPYLDGPKIIYGDDIIPEELMNADGKYIGDEINE